jgi:NAD(P)-dependent dehydrogenase (short-subunit alcohol dehydrogenase family)
MPLNTPIHDWSGKHVWVVGASTGIGRETARLLASLGARVAFSARNEQGLLEAAAGCAGARVIALDVTQADAVADAARTLVEEWGHLDVVLVAAGTYQEMRAPGFDLQRARQLMDVNVWGPWNCVAATLPAMLARRGGHLAIMASVVGSRGLPKALVYGASKAALINFCESLYIDCRPFNVNIHVINPGFVDTPLTAGNDFKMPAIISASEAARQIVRGFSRGEFDIHFPKRFTRWVKFMRLLPYGWYFAAVRKVTGL